MNLVGKRVRILSKPELKKAYNNENHVHFMLGITPEMYNHCGKETAVIDDRHGGCILDIDITFCWAKEWFEVIEDEIDQDLAELEDMFKMVMWCKEAGYKL